ncbi:MAG: 3-isopropylmalate dehydratase large subunit [Acidimicrobiia bacterium]|nr:MAG: 3-isopropylmalate dehydratase large subunit [Acidimicrobiia bacterium]
MGQTVSQKIIARAGGREEVVPDEVLWVDVDLAMIHDSGGPRRIWPMLTELGVGVFAPDRLVLVADHYVPAQNVGAAQILETTRAFAVEFGIERFHEAQGIAHTLMVEKAYLRPGMLYVGGDSHTCTGGVLGCLALGMGSTDLFGVVATGRTWLRVPHTIRVEIDGEVPAGVTAKDLILTIIGDRGMAGGLYRVLEFGGSAIAAMSVEERSVLTNMCVEIGAKTGIVPSDAVTVAYLEERGVEAEIGPASDADCDYLATWRYDASELEPVVARPHRHDDVVPAGEVDARVTRAYIGACTGAKYTDLAMAAEVLRGRSVAPGVLLQVAPASRAALAEALADGTVATLVEAGAHILSTGCGACPGIGSGVLGPGEVCISTTSRNARGRMGSLDSEVYLASAYSVAAAAITGKITDPRELIGVTA